jgi:GTP-binding nuclear protein Ran
LIGDGGVGETTFVTRHQTDKFVTTHVPTVKVNVHELEFYTTRGWIRFNVWDTVGQEGGTALQQSLFIAADAAIIMFDLTCRATYENVKNWYEAVKPICDDMIVLVGNKVDSYLRTLHRHDITFPREYKIPYYEISAKSRKNFTKPFMKLTRLLACKDDIYFIDAPALSVLPNAVYDEVTTTGNEQSIVPLTGCQDSQTLDIPSTSFAELTVSKVESIDGADEKEDPKIVNDEFCYVTFKVKPLDITEKTLKSGETIYILSDAIITLKVTK